MGYIRVDRKILDWEWYKDNNTKNLFFHLLLKANWKDGNFMGNTIPRGTFVTSLQKLATETGMSIREIRTALEHLKTTGEVTCKTTNRYSMVTITNYEYYQADDTPNDTPKTKKTSCKKNDINAESEALFNKLWSMYPFIKSGKSSVSDAKKKKIYTEVGEEQFIRCLERFKQHKCNEDPKYVVRASTFFNTTYVDYLDDNYKETMSIIDAMPYVVSDNGQTKRNLQ